MKKTLWAIGVVVVVGGLIYLLVAPGKPGIYDGFAQCVKDSGALFYGAFWCPHCREQKALFGKSVKLLPYVECSTPDGKGQIQRCNEVEIKSYPTWIFPDGTRVGGVMKLEALAEKTNCALTTTQ